MKYSVPNTRIPTLFFLSLLAFTAIAILVLPAPVRASTPSNGGPPGPDGISVITLPTSTSDVADYATSCPGALSGCSGVPGTSWGSTIYSVTNTGTTTITITDCCYEGDYYALYMTTDPAGLTGWTLVGTTVQVNTGPELVAPTFDPTWTGTGVSYSSTTFNIPQTGTVLYSVRDVLFDTMVTDLGPSCGGAAVVTAGCSATGISASASWSPAGFDISFAQGLTAGCLDPSGSTSWPTATFTDFSTADVSVTGGTPPGACAQMSIEDLFTTNPEAPTAPPVTSPNYYELSISGLTAGTAHVCFTTALASTGTTMMYWDGSSWVLAGSISASSGKICGDVPVSAVDAGGAGIVIGTPTGHIGVPQFGSPAVAVAAIGLVAFAILSRKFKFGPATPQ